TLPRPRPAPRSLGGSSSAPSAAGTSTNSTTGSPRAASPSVAAEWGRAVRPSRLSDARPTPGAFPLGGALMVQRNLSGILLPAANERLAQHLWKHRADLFAFRRHPGAGIHVVGQTRSTTRLPSRGLRTQRLLLRIQPSNPVLEPVDVSDFNIGERAVE